MTAGAYDGQYSLNLIVTHSQHHHDVGALEESTAAADPGDTKTASIQAPAQLVGILALNYGKYEFHAWTPR
jgi:hypothetical protein